jgi:hypothetical protein
MVMASARHHEGVRTAGSVLAALGAALVLFGGFYNLAGKPTAKESPYLGLVFPGRVTTQFGRAAPYIWRGGAVLLVVGVALQRLG